MHPKFRLHWVPEAEKVGMIALVQNASANFVTPQSNNTTCTFVDTPESKDQGCSKNHFLEI